MNRRGFFGRLIGGAAAIGAAAVAKKVEALPGALAPELPVVPDRELEKSMERVLGEAPAPETLFSGYSDVSSEAAFVVTRPTYTYTYTPTHYAFYSTLSTATWDTSNMMNSTSFSWTDNVSTASSVAHNLYDSSKA